jgi:predicted RNA-binding protein (virulence factor B family)
MNVNEDLPPSTPHVDIFGADRAATLLRGLEASRELHKVTDALTEELAWIEVAFKNLRLGVSAGVPLTEDLQLHFDKEGKTWRLTVKSATGSQHLLNASREARVLAVGKLNTLLDALVEAAIQKAEEVRAATNAASNYHSALRAFIAEHAPKGETE